VTSRPYPARGSRGGVSPLQTVNGHANDGRLLPPPIPRFLYAPTPDPEVFFPSHETIPFFPFFLDTFPLTLPTLLLLVPAFSVISEDSNPTRKRVPSFFLEWGDPCCDVLECYNLRPATPLYGFFFRPFRFYSVECMGLVMGRPFLVFSLGVSGPMWVCCDFFSNVEPFFLRHLTAPPRL